MKPLIAAITVIMFATAANAQMKATADLAKTESTQGALQATDQTANAMSFQKVVSLSRAAERETIANTLPTLTADLVAQHVSGATELLRSGQVLDISASTGTDQNAMQQRSINVHVSYDARPVGGILSVRVELVPVFGGIGSAVRPMISREFAQAVNDFDDDFIGQTISQLSAELSAEYAAK